MPVMRNLTTVTPDGITNPFGAREINHEQLAANGLGRCLCAMVGFRASFLRVAQDLVLVLALG